MTKVRYAVQSELQDGLAGAGRETASGAKARVGKGRFSARVNSCPPTKAAVLGFFIPTLPAPNRRLVAKAMGLGIAAVGFSVTGFAQAPAAAPHDPRIPGIISALGQAKSIRGTELSPDGQHIVWEVGGRGGSEIELAAMDHPAAAKRVTACSGDEKGTESNAVFSPDSKHLAFYSECTSDHKRAVFLADVTGGSAPRPLAVVDGFAKEMQWSPDGKRLSFLYVEGATRPSGALAAEKPQTGVIGVEGFEVQRVAAVDVASGELTQITPANLHVFEFDWSPDAKKLAFVAAPPPGENNWWVAKLYTEVVGESRPRFSTRRRFRDRCTGCRLRCRGGRPMGSRSRSSAG